jgi:hypothetical protein
MVLSNPTGMIADALTEEEWHPQRRDLFVTGDLVLRWGLPPIMPASVQHHGRKFAPQTSAGMIEA